MSWKHWCIFRPSVTRKLWLQVLNVFLFGRWRKSYSCESKKKQHHNWTSLCTTLKETRKLNCIVSNWYDNRLSCSRCKLESKHFNTYQIWQLMPKDKIANIIRILGVKSGISLLNVKLVVLSKWALLPIHLEGRRPYIVCYFLTCR